MCGGGGGVAIAIGCGLECSGKGRSGFCSRYQASTQGQRRVWLGGGGAPRGEGLHAERLRHKLSVGFVFGLAGVAGLFARVAPVVRLGAGRVVAPRRLVEDGQALKGLAGQRLGNTEARGPFDTLAHLIHHECYFG